MPPTLPSKKEVLLALLEQSTAFIHLDPRRDRVHVPPWFKKQPQLVLQIGLNMTVPIRDLNIDDECVSCTLSFNRSPHFCWIPWQSIFALVGEDQRGMVWPDDVPAELAVQAGKAAPADQSRKRGGRTPLRSVGEPSVSQSPGPAAQEAGDFAGTEATVGGASSPAKDDGDNPDSAGIVAVPEPPPAEPAIADAAVRELHPAASSSTEPHIDRSAAKSKRASHLRLVK